MGGVLPWGLRCQLDVSAAPAVAPALASVHGNVLGTGAQDMGGFLPTGVSGLEAFGFSVQRGIEEAQQGTSMLAASQQLLMHCHLFHGWLCPLCLGAPPTFQDHGVLL